MADPIIKIKRSAVEGKIPTADQLPLGEVALNTYDGKFFASKNVGIGTTVFVVNPWSVGTGTNTYNTYFTAGNVGVGTTNPTEALSVLGKIQIHQKADSTSRLIFRGVPGTSYRWNIDNDSTNLFRIFREDDATAANGVVAVSISTTGTVTANKFSGDGSLLTGITASGSGVVVQNQGSNVGTATTINFSTNLTASFASGTATVSLSNNPSISGILTADQVYTSNNGNGTNVRIGDDLWIGDINVANTTRFSGAQDSTKAFVVFGSSDAVALGRTGTGPLYYGGDFNVAGVSSATSFSGSGTNLTGIVTSIVAGTNITVSGSTGQVTINSTASGGSSSQWVSTDVGIHTLSNVGIGTTNPTSKLTVSGDGNFTGVVTSTSFSGSGTNLTGIVTSIVAGTNITVSGSTGEVTINAAAGGGGGSGKFDTSIDNVLYVTPTGTLDIVGVGTTTSQLTTLPSTAGTEYIIHSIHVTNISNGDAEVTAAFDIDSSKVLATYSSGGGAGIHTCIVSSASSISIGMGVTGTNVDYNTLVTDKSGNLIVLSKPLAGTPSGTLTFTPVSDVVYRLPVPVGSAVELLKQPFVLYASDSIRVQATGVGTGGQAASTTATASSGAAVLTVASATNIAAGQLVGGTGIATNTYVGVGYTPASTSVPITRATTAALSSGSVTFTDLIVPQDGALHTTIVYQSTTDTAYQNGTSAGVGVGTTALVYYGTGTTYPAVVQSIRVANISDIGDYPVWVGIGNSDTVFSWLAYNMVIPKNSSIELCEAPKRLGIGQSIFAYSDTVNSIEIQIAAKQKTT